MKTKFSLLLMLFFSICAFAQQIDINGVVTTESDGMPLPGANVLIKGTSRGTTTDFDGKFTIKASRGEEIEFSYVGLETQIILIQNQLELNIILKDDVASLNEVIVIGYGTQKKADLTSAITTIKPEDLHSTPSAQLVQGFQGKVAGVQISSIGSPGETAQVRIRGANSLSGDSSPLYVVDGMFYDSIDFLNSNEIENVSILKDASASAIYGVRAANGVILITTKGGKFNKKPEITFSTYYGMQNAQNVLKMANAEQFVTFAQESGSASEISSVDQAIQRFGRSRINPNIPDVNTDWYDEVLRLASIENYDLQVNGGSESISYSLGGNFFLQDGILDMKNSYERFNVRAKVNAKATDWLNVGGNILFSNAVKYDDEASAWQLTYFAVPILPVYDNNFVDADPSPFSDAREVGYRDTQNPFPLMNNSDRRGERRRTTANFYADFQIIPDYLSFKTTISYNYLGTNERIMLLPYYITDDYQRSIDNSSITRTNSVVENYIFDNVLTYTNTFGEHDLTVMAGTSFRDDYYRTFSASGNFDPGGAFLRDNEQTWYIQNTAEDSRTASDGGSRFYGMSYFGRVQYKFNDKYLAYATFRSEGSNKYENTYVNLPAFGLGWEISKESFMQDISFLDYLKLRAGWGKLANNAVGASIPISASTISTVFNDTFYNGFQFSTVADDVDWEYTEELNVGLSANLFNNRLSIEADYFIKDTKNLVINILPLVGTGVSSQNAGSVRNQGIELAATWNGQISKDFGYTVSGNFSTIDNEITGLAGQPYLNTGTAEARQRLIVGEAINSFYGYEIEGVYQNAAEVAADPNIQSIIADGTVINPGYFKYRDLNNDGTIDASDRKVIGSPVPTYYFGGNIGLNYKAFELNVAFYGQGGNVILNTNRMEVIRTQGRNIDAELAVNRWRGEGTSNEFPSSEGYRNLWNQKLSEFFLQDGDFFRIQNIQLAYTLKEKKLPEIRFTLTADRPVIWTNGYNGFNPEVGFDGRDTQTYPTPSVYTFGVTVKF